jgi:hypothetical protein
VSEPKFGQPDTPAKEACRLSKFMTGHQNDSDALSL